MEESIFTKIIRGDIPCHKVYEDDSVIAFLDIHPITPGHTLVVPKQQIDSLWDLPDDLYHYLWEVAKKIEVSLQANLSPRRVGVIVEGSDVPHAHLHLVPLYKPHDLNSPQDMTSEPDHVQLAQIATKLAI